MEARRRGDGEVGQWSDSNHGAEYGDGGSITKGQSTEAKESVILRLNR